MPTRTIHPIICGVLLILGTAPRLSAQAGSADSMKAAFRLRAETAAALASGQSKPEEALDRLRKANAPMGLHLEADGEFAFAAIDVGRRLLGAGKPVEAEIFFRAAEASLDLVIARAPAGAKRNKAQYLGQRGVIRANYLNKLAEGRADLEAALQVLPDDEYLRQLLNLLPADPAATLQHHQKAPR